MNSAKKFLKCTQQKLGQRCQEAEIEIPLQTEVSIEEGFIHLVGLYMRKRSNSSCWIGTCSVEL